MSEEKRILMLSLGNICRSPIAEAVMLDIIHKAGKDKEWCVDSAAIGAWHTGDLPDHRAMNIMKKNGLNYLNRARQIRPRDYDEHDYIFGMDEDNMRHLRRLAPPDCRAKILMLGDFGLDKADRIIEDPYYFVGEAPFEKAYIQCVVACEAFFKEALAGNI